MESDENMETISLDLTVPDTPPPGPLVEETPSIHPKRGTFNLESALQQSRSNGYGNLLILLLNQNFITYIL